MTPDDHVDVSRWISWFNEYGVFMSNVVIENMLKDIKLEQIARKLEEGNEEK